MLMKKKIFAVMLIPALLVVLSAPRAFAVSREELLPSVFNILGQEVPSRFFSEPEEPYLTGRSAITLILEAMGWGFEVRAYEQLTLLPEFSELDALKSLAAEMIPAAPSVILGQLDEPITDEDASSLMRWLEKCKKNVEWKAAFAYDGTMLTLYKRGIGSPTGKPKSANEPLFAAMLAIDLSVVPCEIATAVMAGGKRLELARIAEENYGVIGGINGGYFSGEKPIGTLRRQGFTDNAKFWPYRSAFGWNDSGEFIFIDGKEVSQIEGNGGLDKYTEVLQAGPLLLKNGHFSPNIENIHENIINQRHPRTIVGTDGNRIIWGVIDGRDSMHSVGTTIEETRALCKKLGMTTALNLDGGGSSSLWWRGMTLSRPSNSHDTERPIPYAVLMFQEGHGVRQ